MVAAAALAGCAETVAYVYHPTQQVTASNAGRPASHYTVPPEAPRGTVDVTTFGLTKMQMSDGYPEPFIHARMIVANNNDVGPWVVDTREQLLSIPKEGQSRPAYVNTDAAQPPVLQIAAGEKRVIDLYYPLPGDRARAAEIPEYDLLWHVRAPTRIIAERTPFERTTVEPMYADGYPYYGGPPGYSVGWGPVWWYDPLYPSVTFAHPVIIHRAHPVVVHRPFVAPRHVWIAHPTRRF
jgi:hypothetical protein